MGSDTTCQETFQLAALGSDPTAVLAVVYSHDEAERADRYRVQSPFIVGRLGGCSLPLADQRASKRHCGIFKENGQFVIKDLGSSNGTFVDGERISQLVLDKEQHVVRVGRTVFVFHSNAGFMLAARPSETFGITGPFHAGALMSSLREASLEKRNVLLCGPSGSGKERAALAFAMLLGNGGKSLPVLTHNCARFSSEEEATSTLFGVGARVFSNVDGRTGLVERANGGVLFLDEVHNLPERVQRSLLRVIEDGQTTRIGESKSKDANVRFVFASNADGATKGMAHDLLARLRQVPILPLAQRRADIPALFNHLLISEMAERGLDPYDVLEALMADHYELLCNNDFEMGNVRELKDLALRIVTKKLAGKPADQAVDAVFAEVTGKGLEPLRRQRTLVEEVNSDSSLDPQLDPQLNPKDSQAPAPSKADAVSRYEAHRETIINIYRMCDGNTSATRRELEKIGIETSYRWLSSYLKKWGVV